MPGALLAAAPLARGIPGVVPVDGARRRGRADDPVLAPGDLVLARSDDRAGGDRPLLALARSAGAEEVVLPQDEGLARWVVAVAARWAGEADVARRLRALVSALGSAALPLRAWGPEGALVPALRMPVLARWLACAWCPCAVCRSGGGVAGGVCGACGAPIGVA